MATKEIAFSSNYYGDSSAFRASLKEIESRYSQIASAPGTMEKLSSKEKLSWARSRTRDFLIELLPALIHRMEGDLDPDKAQSAFRLKSLKRLQACLASTELYKGYFLPIDEALTLVDQKTRSYVGSMRMLLAEMRDPLNTPFLKEGKIKGLSPVSSHLDAYIDTILDIERFDAQNKHKALTLISLADFTLKVEQSITKRFPHVHSYQKKLDLLANKIQKAADHILSHQVSDTYSEDLEEAFRVLDLSLGSIMQNTKSLDFPTYDYVPDSMLSTIGDMFVHHQMKSSSPPTLDSVLTKLKKGIRTHTSVLYHVLHEENVRMSADIRGKAYTLYNDLVATEAKIPHAEDQKTKILYPKLMAQCIETALALAEASDDSLEMPLKELLRIYSNDRVHTNDLFLPLHNLNISFSKDFRKELYQSYSECSSQAIPDSTNRTTKVLEPDLLWRLLIKKITKKDT